MTQLSRVGYIGLGNIGKPSAVRLLQGDWEIRPNQSVAKPAL